MLIKIFIKNLKKCFSILQKVVFLIKKKLSKNSEKIFF